MTYQDKEKRIFLVLCVFTANLLGVTVGLMFSWSSPVLPKLAIKGEDNPLTNPITAEENSWIGSLLTLGAAFGPLLAAFLSEKIGRKWTLIILAIPFAVAFFILAFAKTIALYYFARLFSGLSVGGVFTVLPTYISEVSDDKNGDWLGATFNIFIVTGLLLSYSVGPFINIFWYCIFCAIFPCIFIILFFVFMPETPQYLIKCGREDEARESLRKLRSDGNFIKEFDSIKSEVKQTSASFFEIFKSPASRKSLAISIALVSFQQFSGIDIILFYTQTIFDASGSSIPAEISPIIIGGVQVIGSMITPFVVDRLGRRLLLMISGVGMVFSELPLGLYFYLQENDHDTQNIFWLPVVCLTVYLIFYNFGFGALPWTIAAELFPSNTKSMATSLTACSCWTLSFILTKFFSSIASAIGLSSTFWIFSGCSVIAVLFSFFFVTESNRSQGKSDLKQVT